MIASSSKHSFILLLIKLGKLFVLVQELRKLLAVLCPVFLEAFYGSRLALEEFFLELLEGFDFIRIFHNDYSRAYLLVCLYI